MNSYPSIRWIALGIAWALWTQAPADSLPPSSGHYGALATQLIRFKNAPLLQKANEAVARNDPSSAINYFNKILGNDPGNNAAKLALIELYDRQGRYREGITLCDDLIRQYPDFVDAYCSKAFLAMKIGQFELASAALADALNRIPENVPRRLIITRALAQSYARVGKFPDAARIYTEALAREFDMAAALDYFYLLKARQETAKGRPLLERILAQSPPPSIKKEASYELAQLDRQAGRMPEYCQCMDRLVRDETDARRLYDYGLQLYTAGNYDLALRALTKGFNLEPDPRHKFEAGLFIAGMFLQHSQAGEARSWLQKVSLYAGTDARWPEAMARADFLDGNYRACIDRLMAMPERPASVNLLMGFAFLKRGMPGPALESFYEIDDPDTLSPADQLTLYRNRAYLNFDQNQYHSALMDAGEALAIEPSTDMALVHLQSLANTNPSNDIEKAGARLLSREKSGLLLTGAEQAQVLLVMGRYLYRQEKYDHTVHYLTASVKLDPPLAEAFYLRGLAYHALGKTKEALTNYQEYVRLETNPPATFWGDLGQAEGKRREYKNGTAALNRSLEYHSVDVDTLADQGYQFMKWAFSYQGTNHSILGRWNHNREAKESFRRALEFYADLVPRVPTNETAAYRTREVAMKQEYTKLDRIIGIQGYISRTDYGFPTNVGISSVDGALPSQGGLELSLRPPVIGFLNERTLDVFGNVSGNFKRQTWTPDPDSYQGMVGLRVKPFIRLNYNMSFARLFKIGDNAEDNWLWRNMASWERGEKPAPGKTVGLNLKLFGDLGYYFDPRVRWYGYLDGRAGPSWRLHQNVFLTLPQLMGILRYETNDEGDTGSYGLAGIGGMLRLFEPERRLTINRLYLDGFAYYTWGQFMSTPNGFDGRSFEGPIIGISLVK